MENTETDTAAFPDAIRDETIEQTPADTLPPERETYTELLECELTEQDRDQKRQRLETVDRELVRLDTEKKAAAKVFTNQIKPLAAERGSILEALDSGTEKRQVEVYEHLEPRLGKVEVRRVDTDALVEERAMTAEELDDTRQGDLFGSRDSDPPAELVDPADPVPDDDEETFEPTAEALAQAAEDTGRVVRTSAAEARRKRKEREQAAAESGGADGV